MIVIFVAIKRLEADVATMKNFNRIPLIVAECESIEQKRRNRFEIYTLQCKNQQK